MHKHTTDWLRQVHLTPDAAIAQKRWDSAEAISNDLKRDRIINLLRLFLFQEEKVDFTRQFTEELVAADQEFPVKGNFQELRLMAGLVIVSTIEKSSPEGNAFALGIRCVNFPSDRTVPAQPEIIAEAETYLQKEANRRRPNELACDENQAANNLESQANAVTEAVEAEEAAQEHTAEAEFRLAVVAAIGASHRRLAARTEQLAEEVSFLWWVFNEYSEVLNRPTMELKQEEYALIAAVEAAQRTNVLPPPPSIAPLLRRALQNCKAGKKKPVLSDYLQTANPVWRAKFLKSVEIATCRDLVPICAGLEKTEELGDTTSVTKALAKLCPGVPADLSVSSEVVAKQFYAEIVFLRALAETKLR